MTALRCVLLVQQILQGRWAHESSLLMLPHVQSYHIKSFRQGGRCIEGVAQLMHAVSGRFEALNAMLEKEMSATQISQVGTISSHISGIVRRL